MHTRLLSFLSDFERALAADDPAPLDGTWETSRTVNYHLGLARLNLSVRTATGLISRGQVLLQSYALADGTPCLKAALSWNGSAQNATHSIFSKPEVNWTSEARKVAAEWMAVAVEIVPTEDAAAPLAAAV
ncbi:MAG: hypothetical protein KF715_20335 [Candidatus Didemnitutus sp.]|nr:hypothetical protein [Candidatus Didemnitutus sp.]